jgi:hypothetical protein
MYFVISDLQIRENLQLGKTKKKAGEQKYKEKPLTKKGGKECCLCSLEVSDLRKYFNAALRSPGGHRVIMRVSNLDQCVDRRDKEQ